jgi:hypothetical protein
VGICIWGSGDWGLGFCIVSGVFSGVKIPGVNVGSVRLLIYVTKIHVQSVVLVMFNSCLRCQIDALHRIYPIV